MTRCKLNEFIFESLIFNLFLSEIMTKIYTEKEAKILSEACYDMFINNIRLNIADVIMIPKRFGKISIIGKHSNRKSNIYIREPNESYLKWLRNFHEAIKFVLNAQNLNIRYE